jgi:hypothetical protein
MAPPVKTFQEQLRDAEEIARKYRGEIVQLKREIVRKTADRDSAEKIRTELFGIADYSPEPPKWLVQEPKNGSTSGIPLICLNDWHWGETVDPDQVGGLNKFNRRIARQRVHTLFDTVNDLCFNHMTNPNYPGAVVAILGDMITGCIHDDLRETNDGPLMWSLKEVENHIIALLEGWADKFGRIAAICVPGNHGRNTIKPRNNNKVYESYEWGIYCSIEKHFRRKAELGDDRVTVYVPNEVDAFCAIFGHRLMITHGDTLGVKGGDGLIGALGPISRGTLKIGAQQRQAGRDFNTLVIGHYHIYVPRGDAAPVLVSPCLVGHNNYAHLMLRVRASRPSQALTFFHPKHGITAQWPMYLDKQPQNSNREPWFKWTGGRLNTDLGLDA